MIGQLPEDATRWLKQAANTRIPIDDPNARIRAVEAAIEKIRQKYPLALKEH